MKALSSCCFALALLFCCFPSPTRAQDGKPTPKEERRVYVPLKDLQAVFERDQKGVLLPREEFEQLHAAARANEPKTNRPSAGLLVTGTTWQARLEGDRLVISAEIRFRQFPDEWQSLALPLDRLAVERALLDDQPARLGRIGKDNTLTLLSQSAGTHTLSLELSTELTAAGGDQAVAFGLVPSPVGTFSMTLPAGKRLVSSDVTLERPAPIEEAAEYELAIGGQKQLSLRITERADDDDADSLTFATTGYGLNVAPGKVTWHALTTLQVFGDEIDRVVFTVPQELEITSVNSNGLDSWELGDAEGGGTAITLNFAQPFQGARKVALKGVMTTTDSEPWRLPPLQLPNVDSHIGRIVIQHSAAVRLRIVEAEGVRQTAEADTSIDVDLAEAAGTERIRFDVWQQDFTLSLVTQPKEAELQAAIATVLNVSAAGLGLEASIALESRFAPLYELDLTLPAEWTIAEISVNGTAVQWQVLTQEAGMHQVRIPLPQPLAPGNTAQVKLSANRNPEGWPVEEDPIAVPLPEVRLPQSTVSEGTYVVRGDDDLEIVVAELSGLDPAPLEYDWEKLRFVYQDTRFSGELTVSRKPAQLSAQTLTFLRRDPAVLAVRFDVLLDIRGGGLRTVRMALPEETGTSLRFELLSPAGRIVEQRPSPPEKGERVWTLQFDRRMKGDVPLSVEMELPLGEADRVETPALRVLGADRQSGFIAVEADGDQRLEIEALDAQGVPLNEVDAIDLPASSYQPRERIVAVYRYVMPGYRVTLAERRFDRLPVPTAVCHAADVSSILGQTGEFQHRAAFKLTAVGVQSLLVRLPEKARLWAARVDENPVEIRSTDEGYLVPLPVSGSNARRTLELFYRTTVGPLDKFGTLVESPPVLLVISGRGEPQPLEVLERNWTLHYPPETAVLESDGAFAPREPMDRLSLITGFQEGIEPPTVAEVLRDLLWIVAAAGLIGLFAAAYRRWRLEGSLAAAGALAVLAVIGLLLLYSSPAQYRESASSVATSMALDDAPEPTSGAKSDWSLNGVREGGEMFSRRGEPMQRGAQDSAPAAPASEPAAAADPFGDRQQQREKELRENLPQTPMPAGAAVEDSVAGESRLSGIERQPAADERWLPASDLVADADDFIMSVGLGEDPQRPRGLLSLSIDLEPPAGSLSKSFQYVGTDSTDTGAALNVDYANRATGVVYRLFLIAAVALLFWVQRVQPFRTRLLLGVLGVAVPIALVPLVSASWQVVLDGVLLGSLAGILLWLVRALASATASLPSRVRRYGRTAALLAAGLLCVSQTASAQDKARAKPSAAPRSTEIVIPYEAGADPLAGQRIYLPHEKFVELWNQAHPERRIVPPAPVEGFVAEALYDAKLQDGGEQGKSTVAVTGRIALYSFREHQITLSLPLGGIALTSATLNGTPAAVTVSGDKLQVLLDKAGLHVLDIAFAVPVQQTGPAGEFTLKLSPVPAGKLTFTLPAADLTLQVNGSTTAYRRRTDDDVERVEIPIDRGGDLTVAWRPQQQRGAVARFINVDAATAVVIDNLGVRLSSGFKLAVRQGTLQEQAFSLPAGVRVQRVTGPDLAGWEIRGEGDERTLQIFFRQAITESTELTFDLYLDRQIGTEAVTIAVPQFFPLDVTHESGMVGVFAAGQFTARAVQTQNVTQIPVDRFKEPAPLNRPEGAPQLAWRYLGRPFTLELNVERQAPQMTAVARHGIQIGHRKLHLTSRFQFELTGAPRSGVAIALPDEFVLLRVNATDLSDWYVTESEGESVLTVEFTTPRTGQVEVVLEGARPREPEDATAELVAPRPLDVTRLQSQLAVWLREGHTATLAATGNWRALDVAAVAQEIRALQQQPVQFALESSAVSPGTIVLDLSRAVPRVTADGVTVLTVSDSSLGYALALQWNIRQAATDTLALTAPDWLDNRLEFQGEGIRQVNSAPAGEGRTRWTIRLRAPVRDGYFATATAVLPPPRDNIVRAPALVFEQPAANDAGMFNPLETQRLYVLLINHSQGQLTAADPALVEPIAPQDLPITVRQTLLDQAVELVRVRRAGGAPSWSMQRFARQQGIPASVNVADITTVIARDGTYRAQVVYTIKNRWRQFLALRIPLETQVLSVFVQDRPSRGVQTEIESSPALLVALPKTSEADLAFQVRLIFAGRLPDDLPLNARLLSKSIELPAPQVVEQAESAEFGIPVARTRWTVYVPEHLRAFPVDDPQRTNLRQITEDEADVTREMGLLQEASELLGVLESSRSYRVREQARNNLKQIEGRLKSAQSTWYKDSGQGQHAEVKQFQKQADKVLDRVEGVNRDFDADGTDPALPALGLQFDDRAQMLGNSLNAQSLYADNAGKGYHFFFESEKQAESFGFELQSPQGRLELAQPADQRAEESGSRAKLRAFNADQISELGREAESKTPAGSQPADGEFGRYRFGTPAPSRSGFGGQVTQEFSQMGSIVAGRGTGGGGMAMGEPAAGTPIGLPGPPWTQAGGLSLEFEIPRAGHALTFSKVGGSPKLALAVRPQESFQLAYGILWALGWLGLAAALIVLTRRPRPLVALGPLVSAALVAIGLLGFVLLPSPFSAIPFALFLAGLIGLTFRLRFA